MKVRRAKRHATELGEIIDEVTHPDRYRFDVEIDPQTGEHVYKVYGVPAVDPEWSILVGEILFNLRSGLDQLAWQLVLLDGGKPGEQTQFPIRDTPFDKKGHLTGAEIRPKIRDPQIGFLIERFQPYRGMGGEPGGMIGDEPLLRLARLNNIDKHRLLLVCVTVLDTGRTIMSRPPAELNTRGTRVHMGPAEDGLPVLWLDFYGQKPPAGFDMRPALTIGLLEPSMPELRSLPLMSTIDQLCFWLDDWMLDSFRPLFQ